MIAAEQQAIARFHLSSCGEGLGYVAAARPTSSRLRCYKWIFYRVVRFTDEGANALVSQLGSLDSGNAVVSIEQLTPAHELPLRAMRKVACIGWPERSLGGMQGLLRIIESNRAVVDNIEMRPA